MDSGHKISCCDGKTKKKGNKNNPSFKSKRYRDKLRTEVKALESLVPVNRTSLHKKLDSQTVYRLVLAYLRIKSVLSGAIGYNSPKDDSDQEGRGHNADDAFLTHDREDGDESDPSLHNQWPFDRQVLYQILEGVIFVLSADGTIMFVSENVPHYTGFSQYPGNLDPTEIAAPVNFFCRIKCYIGNTTGYTKFHCIGKLQHVARLQQINRSELVAILYCRPFLMTGTDVIQDSASGIFWSKHYLDLKFQAIEENLTTSKVLGYNLDDLCGTSLYELTHPEDLSILVHVHKAVTKSAEVQTFRFRLQAKNGNWTWLHSKGKVISKNSKKYSILFTHCPVRDEEDEFLHDEAETRRVRFQSAFSNTTPYQQIPVVEEPLHCIPRFQRHPFAANVIVNATNEHSAYNEARSMELAVCPSSWHVDIDRHSPLIPSSQVSLRTSFRDKPFKMADSHKIRRTEVSSEQLILDQCLFRPRSPRKTNKRISQSECSIGTCASRQGLLHENTNHFPFYHDSMNRFTYPMSSIESPPYDLNMYHEGPRNSYSHCNSHGELLQIRGQNTYWNNYLSDNESYNIHPYQDIYSTANVRFSVFCDASFATELHTSFCNTARTPDFTSRNQNRIKDETNGQSCAFAELQDVSERQGVKYDIEASVYMRIVESQNPMSGKNFSAVLS